MDFPDALRLARQGHRVRRAFWVELGGQAGMWLETAELETADGRKLGPQEICPLPDGTICLFAWGDLDRRAGDWEIAPDGDALPFVAADLTPR